jgi:N-acetylglucosaminyldiphosphoundecaprenol N-acetyl-beta-D-mannosaminyltransferase
MIVNAPVLGLPCAALSLAEATDAVLDLVAERSGGYVSLCNAHVAVNAQHSDAHRRALTGASAVFPDGAPVAFIQRRKGAAYAERVAGPDLMNAVFDRGRRHRIRHFFYGAELSTLLRLEARLKDRWPSAEVVGRIAPPVSQHPPCLDAAAVRELSQAAPDIVWVGLGSPKQDIWMATNSSNLAPAVLIGVGAAFDFLSGRKNRAPLVMQTAGLEWLHRLISEPRRLGMRYLRTNTEFVIRGAVDLALAARDARSASSQSRARGSRSV